jgi:hypothetical protein
VVVCFGHRVRFGGDVGWSGIGIDVTDSGASRRVPQYLESNSTRVRFRNQEIANQIYPAIITGIESSSDGFVSDWYGWPESYYVALRTRLHPARVFIIDPRPAVRLDKLVKFFGQHPTGVILYSGSVVRDSWVREAIDLTGEQAVVAGAVLSLSKVASFLWPAIDDHEPRTLSPTPEAPRIEIFRYRLERWQPNRRDSAL